MIDFFSSIELDKQSFWLGFVAGVIFLWFISRLRKYLPAAIVIIKQKILAAREGLTSNAEMRYRSETLYHLQKMHITSTMFSLDEIVIPPRLLAPPEPVDLENASHQVNIVNLTIPYLPDWPEMAAKYKAPTLSLTEALSNGANITIMGQPGSGRTVALVYLASLLIRREAEDNELKNLLPIYLHAQEIVQTDSSNSAIDKILKIISRYLSLLTQQRLPSLLLSAFEKNRAILLIDGMDEVTSNQYQDVIGFIRELLIAYPKLRTLVTSSHDNIASLSQLGLIPVSLASWDEDMINSFLTRFSQQWRKLIQSGEHPAADQFYNLLILSWLESHNYPQGPLELTLRIWSAYAGDILGPEYHANIEAYIRRTTYDYPEAREVLSQIAAHILLAEKLTIDRDDVQFFLDRKSKRNDANIRDPNELPETELDASEVEIEKEQSAPYLKIESMLQHFTRIGLLTSLDDQVYRFSNPVITGYLAGQSLTNLQEISPILEQKDWSGKFLTLDYYLHFNNNADSILDFHLNIGKEDVLHKRILSAAHWLKNGHADYQWRQKLMRNLALRMQSESITLGLCGRFLSALAVTRDLHIGSLFRQLLSSEDANIRQLAALGCGWIKDIKSVTDLAKLINDPIPGVSRSACLALVAIGDKNALETVATVLIQGNDMVQRYAAESLANHIEEGHPALRDGSKMDDLLVRRAVVFGLARINEPWAEAILDELQLEDQQWLVRNAAIQALEDRKLPKTYIPMPPYPLTEAPWLIEFASKLGIGVAPGKPAVELLIRALRDGDEGLRLAALNFLRINAIEEVIPTILEVYQESLGDVREAAFDTLWHLSASGLDVNRS